MRDHTVGRGYGLAAPPVFEEIARCARLEGLVLDPVYTGKAFVGLLEMIRSGELAGEENVVFLHTGGLFGLLAQRDQMSVTGGPAG